MDTALFGASCRPQPAAERPDPRDRRRLPVGQRRRAVLRGNAHAGPRRQARLFRVHRRVPLQPAHDGRAAPRALRPGPARLPAAPDRGRPADRGHARAGELQLGAVDAVRIPQRRVRGRPRRPRRSGIMRSCRRTTRSTGSPAMACTSRSRCGGDGGTMAMCSPSTAIRSPSGRQNARSSIRSIRAWRHRDLVAEQHLLEDLLAQWRDPVRHAGAARRLPRGTARSPQALRRRSARTDGPAWSAMTSIR